MNVCELSIALYEALQDGVPCQVEIQPIKYVDRDMEDYYLRINGKRYKISKRIAVNAIRWRVPVEKLATQYRLAGVRIHV